MQKPAARGAPTAAVAAPSAPSTPWFREITERSGVRFVHPSEPTGQYALTEIMGSGLAVFDADADGRLDLYFAATGGARGKPAVSRFFRQTPEGRFVDATVECNCGDAGSAMGVAAGDVDNDGDLDLLVTSDGPDVLFINDGHARFSRRVLESDPDVRLGTSAAFVDFDGDGWLDVWIANDVVPDDAHKCNIALAAGSTTARPMSTRLRRTASSATGGTGRSRT